MKLQQRFQIATLMGFVSLLSLVACGTAGSAKTMTPETNAAPLTETVKSPALTAAEDNVDVLSSKRDTARKQLNAARANLRAAELELKAARANKDALAMRETAQNLADDSGFISNNNDAPKQVASTGSRLQMNDNNVHQTTRAHSQDFNAEPVSESPSNVP